jgi:NitT/TauT family transport system substrate-binding protein
MQQIRLAENFRAVFYAPFYAAIALGYCAEEGVDVRLVESASPGAGTLGLLDGSLDVTWGGPMRVMKARDEGGPQLVCFCEVVRRDPFYLVARGGENTTFRLADLRSVRFASVCEVPTPWLCLQHDLREAGIDPASLPRVADRSMGDNLQALARGDLDVIQVFEPYAALAERQGIGRIVHAASARGETSYTTLLALRPGVEKNREAFAAIVRAMRTMQSWLGAHGGKELATVVAAYYPSVDRTDLETALVRYHRARLWATDPLVSRTGFDRLARSLQSGGFISTLPNYEDCVVDALVS